MDSVHTLAVVLSTYNGEAYLAEQLDSLLSQTWSNFTIVVRDDGSSDASLSILNQYAHEHPGRFHLIGDHSNKGARESFSSVMKYVLDNKSALGLGKAYMMFCDQDDIWLDDKVEVEMSAMFEAETSLSETGEELPILIHSDLVVVSQNNEVIANSFIDYQGLQIARNSFADMVISNLVTGCTAVINEALARKAVPVSEQAIMHDWWLALVASAFGNVYFIDRPLLRYRQHDNNTIGAKEFVRQELNAGFLRQLFSKRKLNGHLKDVAMQAGAFRRVYAEQLGFRQKMGLRFAAAMKTDSGLLQRIFYRIAIRF